MSRNDTLAALQDGVLSDLQLLVVNRVACNPPSDMMLLKWCHEAGITPRTYAQSEDAGTPWEPDCPDCGLPHPSRNPYCFCRKVAGQPWTGGDV